MSRDRILIDAQDLHGLVQAGDPHLVVLAVGGGAEGIPGAVPVDAAAFAGAGGGLKGARPLPDIADLEHLARRWGIRPDSNVVLYDANGNVSAARGWWTLSWAGVRSVRLLDGGLAAWEGAGYPFAPLGDQDREGTVKLSGGYLPQIHADEAALYAHDHVLLDARGLRPFQEGHIPGAVNVPANGNLDAQDRFLPDQALVERYGFLQGRKVAVSCGSGVSAAHDVAALAIIGIEAPLFVGSFSAWSADPSRPVLAGAL